MCGLTGSSCEDEPESEGISCSDLADTDQGSYECHTDLLYLLTHLSTTRRMTDATVRLGPPEETRGMQASQANAAAFWANIEGGPVLQMEGTYSKTGSDLVVNVTQVAPAQVGQPQSVSIHVTMTSATQGAGTIDYVESGDTYRGDISVDKYPD